MACLSIIEISKKQSYIFNSNKLRDHVGASLVIRQISEQLAYDQQWLSRDDVEFRCSSYALMEGGGQAVYIFPTEAEALQFNRRMSGFVLREYPGVELFCCSLVFDEDAELLPEAVQRGFQRMASKKSARQRLANQFSYGQHEVCARTGMPASVRYYDEWISEEIRVKRKMADEEQTDEFAWLVPEGFKLSREMEDLVGSQEEKSFVAVVHIDGNQMGKKLTAFHRYHRPTAEQSIRSFNSNYRKAFLVFSRSVDRCYKSAFKRMAVRLAALAERKNREFWQDVTQSGKVFPLRPLILAGDDVSYVVNGKLGLDSARMFLEELQMEAILVGTTVMTMHACAGVALVKKGYPFARAHHLAEQLCKQAKTKVLADNQRAGVADEDTLDLSALDFHVISGETDESLRAIRHAQYVTKEADLCLKPYYVLPTKDGQTLMEGAMDENGQLWSHERRAALKVAMDEAVERLQAFPRMSLFEQTLKRVSNPKVGRHKIKLWREAYHKSESEQRYFLGQNQMQKLLERLDGIAEGQIFVKIAGQKHAVYYDAIEMMDLMLSEKAEEVRT